MFFENLLQHFEEFLIRNFIPRTKRKINFWLFTKFRESQILINIFGLNLALILLTITQKHFYSKFRLFFARSSKSTFKNLF